MDKRYQVFVSSTFKDLIEERQAVTQALLEMDAIPAGMELFPAANEDAWKLIERVIEQADYYVLVIGGRYGSTDAAGLSYTEREYDLAMRAGVPVLAFLHEHPENIPAGKTELSEPARAKLEQFRAKVEKEHHCKYWNDAEQLGSRVTRGLLAQTKTTPRVGWIRADQAGGPEALAELNRLRLQIDSMQEELRRVRTEPPKGAESLSQGEDMVPLKATCSAYDDNALQDLAKKGYANSSKFIIPFGVTWNEVFGACGPLLLQESSETPMKTAIEAKANALLQERNEWMKTHRGSQLELSGDGFQSIKVQLIALGLIQKSDRKRAPSDRGHIGRLRRTGNVHCSNCERYTGNSQPIRPAGGRMVPQQLLPRRERDEVSRRVAWSTLPVGHAPTPSLSLIARAALRVVKQKP